MTDGANPIKIPWRRELRHPRTAPRDGTRFHAIPKRKAEPARFRWDGDMNCYLSDGFALVDELACWWPEPATAETPQEYEARQRPAAPTCG